MTKSADQIASDIQATLVPLAGFQFNRAATWMRIRRAVAATIVAGGQYPHVRVRASREQRVAGRISVRALINDTPFDAVLEQAI